MALVAALPHPAQLVRSTSVYLLAPAALDDGVAFLTVPRAFGDPALMATLAGDRLIVRRGASSRTLLDSGCRRSTECAAVLAPSGDAAELAYGVPADGGGGYVARAGADGVSRLVGADEGEPDGPLVYAAGGGRTVFTQRGAIASRTGTTAATTLVRAADTGGDVRAVAAATGAIAWVARPGSRGAWRIGVKVGTAAATAITEARRGVRIGEPAVGDDGTVAFARRVPVNSRRVRFEIVVVRPGVAERVVAASPAVLLRDRDALPRIALRGTRIVYRLRTGGGGRWDGIFLAELQAGTVETIARLGRRVARISDPSLGATGVVWAQTDFRQGRYLRSRVLRVRRAL